MNEVKKISTHIPGLDELFYGGISRPDPNKGTIIVLRGKTGSLKMQFAINLMCGLTRTLISERFVTKVKYNPTVLYPLYKDCSLFRDLCDDFQIQQLIYEYIDKFIKGKKDINYIAELTNLIEIYELARNTNKEEINTKIADKIANGAIYYNPRTHTLQLDTDFSASGSRMFTI